MDPSAHYSARRWRGDLPQLELDCMRVLWENGEATVRDVRDRLHPRRPLAYTTVLTVLDRLARKGAVERRKAGRMHVYQAAYPQSVARARALERLIENFFGGSPESLARHLAPAAPREEPPREAPSLDPSLL